MNPDILKKAQAWLAPEVDADTRQQVQHLIDNDHNELTEAFYRTLEFGTGGLRGIMGPGTNRINKYTIGMATQGLANYLKKSLPEVAELKAAIAFDTRNNSSFFARVAAEVLSANGIKVYLFEDIRPTPSLSFAVRELKCHTGIVITASHNPKEYNGYKVYWSDGGQLIAPHDKNVITEVNLIDDFTKVNFNKNESLIIPIGAEIDRIYVDKVKQLSLSPDIIAQYRNLNIVFTPIHGTAVKLVPECLKSFGFTNVNMVEEQCIPDGNFPTVEYPNPEEHKALSMAIDKAKAINAELVMATDPDADRVGVACKDDTGQFILLNGNQTASLLIHYILTMWQQNNKLTGREFIVKTIVTTELLANIAARFNVEMFDVLTGFKFIADIIRRNEGNKQFIAGGEESYGYLVGDFVRDKDAVISCCMIAETAAWAASQNKSLYDLLIDIYLSYGFFKEHLISLTKKGISGSEEIAAMMHTYRTNPPAELNNSKVVNIMDFKTSINRNMLTGIETPIDLPVSDVLQFILADGSKITVRPSGTEPKIKFYFSVSEKLNSREDFKKVNGLVDEKIKNISLGLGI